MTNHFRPLDGFSSTQKFLVAMVFVLGASVRLAPLTQVDITMPFGCGGLFLEFAQQIVESNYALPDHIPFYSMGGIPFAYPPLPFYVLAVLMDALPDFEFIVANLLPPLVGSFCLPLFYWLACELKLRFPIRLSALLAYATMPAAFLEQIESAGLAEAFGSGAVIALAITMVRAYRAPTIGRHLLVALAWALAVLASPGSAYASVLMFGLFALAAAVANGRLVLTRSQVLLLGLTGIAALFLSSPYWLTVARRHGVRVFSDSFGAQHVGLVAFLAGRIATLVQFNVSGGAFGFLMNVAILNSLIRSLSRRKWGLPIWFLAMLSVPREGVWLAAIPASILAGVGIVAFYEAFSTSYGHTGRVLVFAGLWLAVMLNVGYVLTDYVSDYDAEAWESNIHAMRWVRSNVPDDAIVVVVADETVREWVPHVAQRTVANVWRGLEWKPLEQERVAEANVALDDCQEWVCVRDVADEYFDTSVSAVWVYLDRSMYPKLDAACDGYGLTTSVAWRNAAVLLCALSP